MKKGHLDAFLIGQTATAVEAMQKIDFNAKGILFVVDGTGRLAGVITDGDIRRWLIKTGDLREEVSKMMNRSPKVIYGKELKAAKERMEKYSITALPVVDAQDHVMDIVFKEAKDVIAEMEGKKALKGIPVVIMAGGKGTRLYPYTKILPKPLIPIGDIPIMERIIQIFRRYGVQQFYATLNYKKSMIKSYFAENMGNFSLRYVEETSLWGRQAAFR